MQLENDSYTLGRKLEGNLIIGDHYTLSKKRSNFLYISTKTSSGFSINSRQLEFEL